MGGQSSLVSYTSTGQSSNDVTNVKVGDGLRELRDILYFPCQAQSMCFWFFSNLVGEEGSHHGRI